MSTQTGPQMHCRQTGRLKNCGPEIWADYSEGHSGDAAMCNGGIYDGDSYDACPSRPECSEATYRREAENRRSLPVVRSGGTQFVGATPAAQQQPARTASIYDKYRPTSDTTLPTKVAGQWQPGQRNDLPPARPAQQGGGVQYQGTPYPIHVPMPVQPPQQFPQAMQTPFAAPVPFHMGGVSPTFIPDNGEGIFERLGKNVAQGMISSFGWHVFDYSRNVDMFGRRK